MKLLIMQFHGKRITPTRTHARAHTHTKNYVKIQQTDVLRKRKAHTTTEKLTLKCHAYSGPNIDEKGHIQTSKCTNHTAYAVTEYNGAEHRLQ
jgi:hypothetical protein